jgi:CRP/FNR family transcriptional regulator, cyclic AMP receptor protein
LTSVNGIVGGLRQCAVLALFRSVYEPGSDSGVSCRASIVSGLADKHLAFLAANATERRHEKDEVVARQGERADRFVLLLDGELVVEIPAISGPKLEVTRLGKGQVFGWSWLIEPYKWHFNARATRPSTVLDFDGAAILAHCEDDPAFGYALFKRFSSLMGARLEAAQQKMMDQWSPSGFA